MKGEKDPNEPKSVKLNDLMRTKDRKKTKKRASVKSYAEARACG